MAVVSHPGTNELETVLATLRGMWERAARCGGGAVPVILSRPPDEVVGKMCRNVDYLTDVQAAVDALCEHTITEEAIQLAQGWCCSEHEPDSWPVYIRDQAGVTSMAFPSRLVLTQDDWFDDISALVTWLSTNVYTGTGCPSACFDQVSAIHPECLSVTGWDSLIFTAVIAETPDPEHVDYDDDYYTWDGSIQWVGDTWWGETCFANAGVPYLAGVKTEYVPYTGALSHHYWTKYDTTCEDKTPLIAGRMINVYLTITGTDYKRYTLTFETVCAGVIVWEGCKEGGGNVAGTYTRTSGRSSAPATITVASTDCSAPCACPCTSWPDEDPANPGYADPDGFPCGGLDYEYVLQSGATIQKDEWGTMVDPASDCGEGEHFTTVTYELLETHTLTATSYSCDWQGIASTRVTDTASSYDETSDCLWSVYLVSGEWRMIATELDEWGMPTGPFSGYLRKTTGDTVAGTFVGDTCNKVSGYTYLENSGSASVTEAAP